jgi:flagellar biogenesis protein FliO
MLLFEIAANVATEPLTSANTVDFSFLFLKTMVGLVIVCIIVIVLLKHGVPRMKIFNKFKEAKYFAVIDRFTLEPKKHLYTIQIKDKYYLLGVTDHSINLICELDKSSICKE